MRIRTFARTRGEIFVGAAETTRAQRASRTKVASNGSVGILAGRERNWLRGLDSNQDSRLQRPMCYQLHHPGVVEKV